MKRLALAFDRWWYAPMPAERLAMLRLAVGAYCFVYLMVRGANLTSPADFPAAAFDPVGPVALLDQPLHPAGVYAALAAAVLSGAAFCLGWHYRLSGIAFALLFLWVTSYRSSWGMKFHTENLAALHLLLLAAAPAAHAWSLDARSGRSPPNQRARFAIADKPATNNVSSRGGAFEGDFAPSPPSGARNPRSRIVLGHLARAGSSSRRAPAQPSQNETTTQPPAASQLTSPHGRYGWAVRAMCLVTVCTYVLAGWAKIRNAGWDWTSGDVLRVHIAYDNVRKLELGSIHSPLGAAAVRYAWLFPPLAWLTLLVELGAPLALLHRRLGHIWAVIAWAFHLGVALLMAILFPYPLSVVGYLSFFKAERLSKLPGLRRWLPRLRPAGAAGS